MNSAARQGEASLESLHGWRELTCQEYEDAIRADDEAHIESSITDPDGVYGSPLTFTLWLMSDGSYLSTALEGRRDTEDYKCSHAITSGAPVEPPVLSREFLDSLIAELGIATPECRDSQSEFGQGWDLALIALRDAILESLSQASDD